jgi:hypothetical protein
MNHLLEFRGGLGFVVSALVLASNAQPLSATPQQWLDQFGTSGVNALRAVDLDGAGALVMAGETSLSLAGPSAGLLDVFAQKRDVDGNLLWQRQYGSAGVEYEVSAAADGAGGLFVAGATTGDWGGPTSGEEDAFLLRLDSAGNLLWIRQFGSGERDAPTFVISDGAGGAILGGITAGDLGSPSSGNVDAWAARYDAAGVSLWLTQFGTGSEDRLESAALDGAGALILGGYTRGDLGGPHAGDTDVFYARMDLAGNLQAIVQFGSPGSEAVTDVLSDGAGGAFLAGAMDGLSFVMRVDASLSSLWSTSLTAFSAAPSSPTIASDGVGGTYVLAETQGSSLFDAWLAQLDGSGALLHALPIPGSGIDYGYDVVGDGVGGLIAVGRTEYGLNEAAGLNEYLAWVGRFGPCDFDAPVAYCVGAPNSTGQGASISSDGNRYVANNDFGLGVSGCPSGQVGLFLMATAQASTPFGDGTLCVGGSVSRLLPAQITDAGGYAALQLDVSDPSSPASAIAPGSAWNFQFWYRDAASAGAGFNLSNALSATFCP